MKKNHTSQISTTKSASRRHRSPVLEHPVITVIIAVALVILILLGFRAFQDYQNKNQKQSQDNTAQSVPTASENSATPADTTTSSDIIPDKTPAQYEGENVNSSSTLTGSITSFAVEGDKLIIRVTIDQLLSSTGNCTLTLTKAGQTLTYTANTIDNPSSASCEGYDIPISDLTAGEWTFRIDVSAGDRAGAFEGKVEI